MKYVKFEMVTITLFYFTFFIFRFSSFIFLFFCEAGWDLMNHEEGVSTSHFDVGTYVLFLCATFVSNLFTS